MTESPDNVAPAGWFVDPMTHRHLRWWNGQAWTESVAPLPGVAPTAPVAPAPQGPRRFAIEPAETPSASPATAVSSTAASSPAASSPAAARQFVHQVPETVAQYAQPEPLAQPDVSPAIPWPAVQPVVQPAAESTGIYRPTYDTYAPNFDEITPSHARSSFVAVPQNQQQQDAEQQQAAEQAIRAAFEALSTGATTPQATQGAHTAQAATAQDAVQQAVAQQAPQATQTAPPYVPHYAPMPAEQPATIAATAAAPTATAPAAPTSAVAVASADRPLPETAPAFPSRRQLRDSNAEPGPASGALRTSTVTNEREDVWAGHDDRGDRVADSSPGWSSAGSRSTRIQPAVATRWSTPSVWLLAATPWLGLAAVVAVLAFFDAWSLPAFGVLLLPYLFALLFAQQDAARLRDLGHERPARAAWALLTAPIYLMMRTIVLERTAGVGTPPIWAWLANLAIVIGGCTAIALAPGIVPGYLVEFTEPLRAAAAEWLTLPA